MSGHVTAGEAHSTPTPRQAAEAAEQAPSAVLLAGLGLGTGGDATNTVSPRSGASAPPLRPSMPQVQIRGCTYDVSVVASSDVGRELEHALFALLEANMRPLYAAFAAQGWTPRVKRGEMRMAKSRFLVLYAHEGSGRGTGSSTGDGPGPRGMHGKHEPESGTQETRDAGMRALGTKGRKRAALQPGLGQVVSGKRARVSRARDAPRREGTESLRKLGRPVAAYTMFQFDTDPYGPDEAPTRAFAEASCAYLYEVQVASGHRGRGLGTWMLARMDQLAARVRVDQLRLTCFQGNTRARCLYERSGFHVDNLTPLDDPDCDYLIMSKPIDPPPGPDRPEP